jgi:hypothetical protein
MKKLTELLVLLACAIPMSATAQVAQYQVIPFTRVMSGGEQTTHRALVINESAGEIMSCKAVTKTTTPIVGTVECRKNTISVGSMLQGPVHLSPYFPITGNVTGFWQVDPSTGKPTFCGTYSEFDGGLDWECKEASIRP